jgi:hypothetical protein
VCTSTRLCVDVMYPDGRCSHGREALMRAKHRTRPPSERPTRRLGSKSLNTLVSGSFGTVLVHFLQSWVLHLLISIIQRRQGVCVCIRMETRCSVALTYTLILAQQIRPPFKSTRTPLRPQHTSPLPLHICACTISKCIHQYKYINKYK